MIVEKPLLEIEKILKAIREDKLEKFIEIDNQQALDLQKISAEHRLVFLCCQQNFYESLRFLVEKKGLEPNELDPNNNLTPLMIAARKGFTKIVSFLLSYPTLDVNAVTPDGFNALFYSIYEKKHESTRLLLNDERTDINYVDPHEGETPLAFAAQHNDIETTLRLLNDKRLKQEQINHAVEKGGTAFHRACGNGCLGIVELFLNDPRTNINKRIPYDGTSGAYMASYNGHIDVIERLLNFCEPPYLDIDQGNGSEEEDVTILMIAARKGHFPIVKLLVENGADVLKTNHPDLGSMTACDYVIGYLGKMKDPEDIKNGLAIIEYLKKEANVETIKERKRIREEKLKKAYEEKKKQREEREKEVKQNFHSNLKPLEMFISPGGPPQPQEEEKAPQSVVQKNSAEYMTQGIRHFSSPNAPLAGYSEQEAAIFRELVADIEEQRLEAEKRESKEHREKVSRIVAASQAEYAAKEAKAEKPVQKQTVSVSLAQKAPASSASSNRSPGDAKASPGTSKSTVFGKSSASQPPASKPAPKPEPEERNCVIF